MTIARWIAAAAPYLGMALLATAVAWQTWHLVDWGITMYQAHGDGSCLEACTLLTPDDVPGPRGRVPGELSPPSCVRVRQVVLRHGFRMDAVGVGI